MKWNYHLELNEKVSTDEEFDALDSVPGRIREEVKTELKKLPESLQQEYPVCEFLEKLDDKELTVEDFDYWLEEFYFFADEHKIWCGSLA